jgi:LCP family protein required for cell wall assembly
MPSDLSTDSRAPRPGLKFGLRILLAGLIVVLAGAVTVTAGIRNEAATIVEIIKKESQVDDATRDALSDVESGGPQTILLVGDDYRASEGDAGGQRSDTMILLRLDPDSKATTMLSLPRDLQVTSGGSTAKLNSAYAAGGPKGLIDTLKGLLSTPGEPFPIHHFVSIRFTAFSKAVNEFGCFYVDIDRKYFNDNNPPAGGGGRYAAIDVPAGYQRLCGEKSLEYVRFRHLDSDLVREARQTHFLAEARAQIAGSTILQKRNDLLKAISEFIKTDIETEKGLLGVVKLAVNVVEKPTKRVTVDVTDAADGNVATTPDALAKAAKDFLHPTVPKPKSDSEPRSSGSSSTGTKPKKRSKPKAPKVPDTMFVSTSGAREAIQAGVVNEIDGLPIYYPKVQEKQSQYKPQMSTGYDIASPGGMKFPWQAYRLVVNLGRGDAGPGQYYGIQGTTWKDPPVLDLAKSSERLGGRTFQVEYDGSRIRRLIWKAPQGTYWITNTLNSRLTNAEMRALARSLTRYGT